MTILRSAFIGVAGLALLAGSLLSPAQTPDRGPLYIAFLHLHARSVERASADSSSSERHIRRIRNMGLKPADALSLDAAAVEFVERARNLAAEARRYHRECEEAGMPVDMAVVESFSARRRALAATAIDGLRLKLSPTSVGNLDEFLFSAFAESMKRVPVAGR